MEFFYGIPFYNLGITTRVGLYIISFVSIQRYFKYTGNTENIPDTIPLEWTEEENQINSHENSPAATALTLDQIYSKAEKDWLVKRKDVSVYFESKK